MAAPRRLRMALLEHELAQVRFQYNLVLAAILEAAERERQRARRRERRWWVREWILRRALFGQYETLMKELEAEHAADFKAFLLMEPQMYYELLNRVGPRITKNDAFPLRQYMLKPYPHRHLAGDERLFNYRCSRARRVVENAFGILANRFRCLLTTLEMRPSTVTKTVMACMTLHNLMRTRYPNIQNADLDREDEQGQFIAGAWRDQAVLCKQQGTDHIYILAEISGRVTAEFRSSSGRASAGVPYIGQPPVLYFPRLCPTSAGARSELRRCPLKKTRPLVVSDARDTGRYSAVHRPTCFPMWLRWGCDEGAR
ncbi:hypothetical protein MAR_037238 [Mya arenaria]|uniref:DDE Tnp4 domain-containing protein n=1 Tax=Mya arenaria TaxID=6604 RepID=A0ABY7FMT9_MYAAR|nr:hypothetical protein MAR_037214 [Mya arenaria]WAR23569.1 hypothetical protein MAR_037238 [Mya arenaria]